MLNVIYYNLSKWIKFSRGSKGPKGLGGTYQRSRLGDAFRIKFYNDPEYHFLNPYIFVLFFPRKFELE